MSFLIIAVRSAVPDPLLWSAAGAASCCVGLALGLYFVNPAAYEILFAEEDDEDAIHKAIGRPALDKFRDCALVSVLANGVVSYYGLESPANIACCAASFVLVGGLTAYCQLQEIQRTAESWEPAGTAQHVD